MNLWKLRRGQCIDVETKTFTHDFLVMLGQLFQEIDRDNEPEVVQVCGEPIDDFAAWVEGQDPEWDRYEPETAQIAVERGLMPDDAYRLEHGVSGAQYWPTRFDESTWKRLVEAGFDRYLENLGKGIRGEPGSHPIPPLIRIEGVPADGRHRTWTALKLRRKTVPVIDVTRRARAARPVEPPPVADFAERYMITTARGGRVYDYASMLSLALRRAWKSPLPGVRQADPKTIRSLVIEALHDEAFMRPRYGMVPTRVAEDVEERVWERIRTQ